jgi:hypothetical protein
MLPFGKQQDIFELSFDDKSRGGALKGPDGVITTPPAQITSSAGDPSACPFNVRIRLDV